MSAGQSFTFRANRTDSDTRRASEITAVLEAVRDGDAKAIADVFTWLYPELKRIARARINDEPRTLTPTVLVHETFMRLVRSRRLDLRDRAHFFACAARAMRAIMVDHVRRRTADKRGGRDARPADEEFEIVTDPSMALLDLDRALTLLNSINPRQCEVVEMRYFGGFEFEEIAETLKCSVRTAKRNWERARAFLHAHLAHGLEVAD